MILTCPDCATRYFVGEAVLPPTGRTVRCTGCGTSWRAMPDSTPLDLITPVEPASFQPEPETLAEVPAPELPKAFRAKQEQHRQLRRAAAAGAVWAGIGAGFVALFASAYLFRVEVVQLYPRAAGAYAAAGVPVNPTGLEFEAIKGEPAEDGSEQVHVTGALRNVRDAAASAPPLKIVLLDSAGRRIGGSTLVLPAHSIGPGQSRTFSTVLADPGFQTAEVKIDFDLDAPRPAPHGPVPQGPAPAPAAHAEAAPRPAPAAGGLRPAASVAPAAPTHAMPVEEAVPLDEHEVAAVSAAQHG
ncbi:MAG TPA: MJ0042-type zinc finger domain-containing protein [Caulobacteraceae bacterium]|jgi:predicted Zn finger-like uncharacterized protein